MTTSRRTFLQGLAGLSLLNAGGCFSIGSGAHKIRLAAVGVEGKGFSDWFPMIKSGLAELVAVCDVDHSQLISAQQQLNKNGYSLDLSKLPYFSDYRKLIDNCDRLGVEAMTIATPDHAHAPIAILAMKKGIHVFVEKPLVRTLWELDYFNRTARENGVIVQMGNQGSSLDSVRRCTEILQSGILGEVTEVHVWTNRPVWPQGKVLADYVKSRGAKGDPIPKDLDWDAFVGTAKARPYLGKFPDDLGPFHNDWKIAPNVYHRFNWRWSADFGCGAFGDMACHTMNLAFRGLELGAVSEAECTMIEGESDISYPVKSIVKLVYKPRVSKVREGVTLPALTLSWYDGDEKPCAELMPKWTATHEGKVPNTGCYIVGTKGAVLMQDDYGGQCAIALNDDKEFVDVFQHEAAKTVARSIPFCGGSNSVVGPASVAMTGMGEGHYTEFLNAIKGVGPIYRATHSRCFSDVEYCIPQMEGILVGCVAQQVKGHLIWDSYAQQFFGNVTANALMKPYIREGFNF